MEFGQFGASCDTDKRVVQERSVVVGASQWFFNLARTLTDLAQSFRGGNLRAGNDDRACIRRRFSVAEEMKVNRIHRSCRRDALETLRIPSALMAISAKCSGR